MATTAVRASCLSFHRDPFLYDEEDCHTYLPDALLVAESGVIKSVMPYHPGAIPEAAVRHYENALIIPGFIDCHVHYPQMEIIGSWGCGLIEWLNAYTFKAEAKYGDPEYARTVSEAFLKELLRNGTTTASVYCTTHRQSVDAFFSAASRYGARMIAGKVHMDRNADGALLDTPAEGASEAQELIDRWHGKGRLVYSITPRFAPTSSPEQLTLLGELRKANSTTHLQTHLSEDRGEETFVRECFPGFERYYDIYRHFGLCGGRAVFGHCVHIDDGDRRNLHHDGSAIAHCPTSNLFLGNHAFNAVAAKSHNAPIRLGLGTDVGAGGSLSLFPTMLAAYYCAQEHGTRLTPLQCLYLATRGGAEALCLEDRLGSLAPGNEADFIVIDKGATALARFRMGYANSLNEILFALITLGDDRFIRATYVGGEMVHDRDGEPPGRSDHSNQL